MGIKRWSAEADTTIANAWKEGLTSRGETANMGIADALEVFVLHGQTASSGTESKELARILIRFDMTSLRQSLADGNVPSSNVNYYLRMFNAVHPETLPRNFSLSIHSLNEDSPFEEGTGLDMSEYADEGAASWSYATSVAGAKGTGSIKVATSPTDGSTFTVKVSTETYSVVAGANPEATRDAIVTALNSSDFVDVANSGVDALTLTAKSFGANGNFRYEVITSTGLITTPNLFMQGGLDFTVWNPAMGINSGPYQDGADGGTLVGTQTFDTGEEDLILDITSYLQGVLYDGGNLRAINDIRTRHPGFIIKITDEDVASSIYTKKFFARSSEFFYKRPCIEARWDESIKDDRGKLKAENSLLTDAQNTQNLYLYNSIDGERTNYTLPGGESLFLKLYSDEDYTQPLTIKDGGNGFASGLFATVSNPSTGAYLASVVIDTSESAIYEKWFAASAGTADEATWTVVHSGKIDISKRVPSTDTKSEKYIFTITNLKKSYSRTEKPRFRVYSRLKDWSPTIYTVARRSLENKIVEKVYYKIFRVVDDEVIFDYGIGTSTTNNNHTLLSYDKRGNYFDFDMSLLEAGYMYGIRLMTSIDGELKEQKEIFKFRVD